MQNRKKTMKLLFMAFMLMFCCQTSWANNADEWPVRKHDGQNLTHRSTPSKRNATFKAKSTAGEPLEFIGNVIYSGDDLDIGIYNFTTESKRLTAVLKDEDTYGNKGAIFANGKYFCVSEFDLGLEIFTYATLFDTKTWTIIKQIESPAKNLFAYCMAQDPTTKIIYGFFRNEANDGWELGTIDIEKMQRTGTVAPMTGERFVSISFSSTGQLYGIGFEEGTLYKIDKETGALTKVGETEISQMYLTSGEINLLNDKYYFAAQSFFDRALYEIDLTTGKSTEIMEEIPGEVQIMGLHVITPAAEEAAPAEVTDFSLNFEAPSLSGTVSFTSPSTTFDGTPANGPLTYTILANGETIATGSTEFGKRENVAVNVPHAGENLFQVRVANNAGQSPVVELTKWIGQDTPAAPASVEATRTEGVNTVSWTAVDEWLHGGEINGAVSYDVTRYPDKKVIASGITDLSLNDNCKFDKMTPVYYGVVAKVADFASEEALSNAVVVGIAEPPYSEDFETPESILGFTIIDEDNDGNSWEYNAEEKAVASKSNKKKNANDWLITPPMNLNAGQRYIVSFTLASESPFDPATVEVKLGKAPNGSDMTINLLEAIELATMENQTFTGEINVDSDGTYYLGFHSVSKPQMSAAILYDIKVSEGVPFKAPESVVINTTPDATGAPTVEIKVTVPSKSIDGNSISGVDKLVCKMNGEVIEERANLKAGEEYTIKASSKTEGYNDFSFVASNSFGEGETLNARIYLGINLPATPENITVCEDGNSGKVTISWDKVAKDIDGFGMIPDLVAYTVLCGEDVIAENITDNEFVYQAVAPGDQAFVKYFIKASTKKGVNEEPGASSFIFVGEPYTVPFVESFKKGIPSHYFLTDGMGQWQTTASEGYVNPDGCIVYVSQFIGSSSTLISGKISLKDGVAPKLCFATLNASNNTDELEISVVDMETNNTTVIGTTTFDKSNDWYPLEYDLSAFNNKNIMLRFQITTAQRDTYSMIDEISVIDEKSGIGNVASDTTFFTSNNGGLLTVKSDNEIAVINLQGATVAQGNKNLSVKLDSGIYIVVSGNNVKKMIIK